jgi:hypothetical protein
VTSDPSLELRAACQTSASKKPSKKAAQGGYRSEGDADADRWQETGEGDGGEEARGQAAPEVSLTPEQESRMDMKEASAMTEASGLTNEEDGDARRLPPQSPAQDAAIRWAERLRKMTMKAPLQSLFVAFLLGIWVARRR